MDLTNSEIDAQLLEQFRCLGTDDRDELIKKFNCIVGSNVSPSICQFFLDLANWNLPKAIGAYFDLNFDSNIGLSHSSQSLIRPQLYDAKFHPSPHSSPKKTPTLIWCVQNSGIASWPVGSYLTVETLPDLASTLTCDGTMLWLPLSSDCRIPVTELSPGSYAHLVVDIQPPHEEICRRMLSTNTPVVGALRLCLPNGSRFGDTLFCSAIPQLSTESILFWAGAPNMPILPPETLINEEQSQQPMEEDV